MKKILYFTFRYTTSAPIQNWRLTGKYIYSKYTPQTYYSSQSQTTHNLCRRHDTAIYRQQNHTYNHTYMLRTSQITLYSTQTKQLVDSSLLILQNITLDSPTALDMHNHPKYWVPPSTIN